MVGPGGEETRGSFGMGKRTQVRVGLGAQGEEDNNGFGQDKLGGGTLLPSQFVAFFIRCSVLPSTIRLDQSKSRLVQSGLRETGPVLW